MPTDRRWGGRFVWRELWSDQPEAAVAFYTALFDWEVEADSAPDGQGPPGLLLRAAHRRVGAIRDRRGLPELPAGWLSAVTVEDLGAALERIVSLGGAVLAEPEARAGHGSIATVTDPQGACFSLFQSTNPGASDYRGLPPDWTFCWTQLLATSAPAVSPFYQDLLGWAPAPLPPGPFGGGLFFQVGDDAVGSLLEKPVGADGPDRWLPYVAVPDVSEAVARATALGAVVFMGATPIEGMGTFAVLADPLGASFAVWKNEGI